MSPRAAARLETLGFTKLVNSQAGLPEYASQGADRNLSMMWHDCYTHTLVGGLCVFDVASSLADLHEARRLQLPFDLWVA